jgi:hypothetical protein
VPNGKAGDHWYTDIVSHRLPTFSREVDALIINLDRIAAAGREYTPWEDPQRQRIERTVDGILDGIGHEELGSRSNTIGMAYRNLTESELAALRAKLEALREFF